MSVHAVLLAAGAGTRFGGGKLSARWGEGTILDAAIAAALAAPVASVVVVTGADPAAGEAVARRADPRLRSVHAADHGLGLSASLRAGLGALPDDAVGALVFLGDMPGIPTTVLEPLVRALTAGAPAAVPVFDGRRGHPAALAACLFPDILSLEGDRGAGALLDRLDDRLVRIPSPDAGVLFDVDRPQDLGRTPSLP